MEDRYLFKAKRLDGGGWVRGSYLYDYGRNIHYIFANEVACPNCINECRKDFSLQDYEVDPSTLCQCTGLKDKNGRMVWENDYLKSFSGDGDDWGISKVVFGEDSLGVGWHEIGVKSLNEYNPGQFDIGLSRYCASRREIIGNIFDNPENDNMTESGSIEI